MSMTDITDSPLVKEILANPDDRDLRLVFADWLEEQGDPRSQLVQFQCQLEQMSASDQGYATLRAKERKLFKQYGSFGNLPSIDRLKWEPRAGFVEWIELTPTRFIKHAEDIFAGAPIREIRLKGPCAKFARLAQIPQLAQLRSLELKMSKINDASFKALTSSPFLSGLKTLRLQSDELITPGETLANASFIEGLTELRISGRQVNAAAAQSLANSPCRLESLTLGYGTGNAAIRAIADSEGLRSLKSLDLVSEFRKSFTQPALRKFGESKFDAPLKTLKLRTVHPGFAEAFELPRFKSLEHLEISWSSVQNSGLINILDHLKNLVELRLNECGIGDTGAIALSRSPVLQTLRKVHLPSNSITLRGIEAILDSDYYTKKTKFYLASNSLTEKCINKLKARAGKSFGNFSADSFPSHSYFGG
jgi:uncharacterized protein (TIGR02996 family)